MGTHHPRALPPWAPSGKPTAQSLAVNACQPRAMAPAPHAGATPRQAARGMPSARSNFQALIPWCLCWHSCASSRL
jgi:hypothetical protein